MSNDKLMLWRIYESWEELNGITESSSFSACEQCHHSPWSVAGSSSCTTVCDGQITHHQDQCIKPIATLDFLAAYGDAEAGDEILLQGGSDFAPDRVYICNEDDEQVAMMSSFTLKEKYRNIY